MMFVSAGAQNYRFEHLGIEHGLSQVTVNNIYQDEFGRMWFATRDGLNMYDGNEIKVYRPIPDDPTSLPKSNIRIITGDNKGYLYLQTTNSVVIFDMKKETFREILKEGNGAVCKSVNGVWIGFKGQLYRHDSGKNELKLVYSLGYKSIEIFTIFETSKKVCLIGTNKGLISVDENLTMKTYFSNSEIRDIHEDKQGNLWVCSSNQGLIKISEEGDVAYYRHEKANPYSLVNNFVRAICEDNLGYIWVGSQFGLSRLDTESGKFHTYVSERENPWSLSSTSIMSLYKDRQGTVWAGTYFGGVNYINPEKQTTRYYYPSGKGLPHGVVGKFVEDKYGIIWICTEGGGLASFDPITEKFESFPLKGNNLKDIYYDPNAHCLWIGTHITYLIKFNIATKQETVYESIPGNKDYYFGRNIMSILPYGKDLLIGTTLGVMSFNPETRKVRPLLEEKYRYGITSMIIDSKNRLWVGSESMGLICYDFNQQTVALYRHREDAGANNLSSNYINIIYEDNKKRIWIGTRGYGLNLYQPETNDFKVFTKEKDGLIDNNIVALDELTTDVLLVGTNIGLSIFNTATSTITNHQTQNGFPLSTINDKGLFVAKDSSIYVGGVSGMAVLTKNDFQFEKKHFNIYFNKLYVNNQEVKQGDDTRILKESLPYTSEIRLRPGFSVFSIGFSTDNYIKTYRDDVQYRLKGYESMWMDARFGRMITYTNLNPGKYNLEVRSKDFPDQTKSISIVVIAPFYRTWIAYLLYFLFAGALLFWSMKQVKTRLKLKTSLDYEKKEKEKNEEMIQSKLKFFTNISHEFRTPITLILGQTENLLQSHSIHPSTYKKILNIHKNASNLNGLINELLDFRKQEQGHLKLRISQINFVEFLKEIYVTFSEYAQNNDISFRFNRSTDKINIWIDVEQMQKVINNLLSNAFKFTPKGGIITISVEENDTELIFSVADTGQGILPDNIEYIFERFYQAEQQDGIPGTGLGLALSKGIIEAHDGLVRVESEVSQGTTFKVILKKGDAHFTEDTIRTEAKKEILNYENNAIDQKFIEEIRNSQESDDGERFKLLIVEDNEDVRNMLKDIFDPIYQVEIAVDGVEGLNKVREFRPDVVISDIMMPRMSGIELCNKIKNNFDICHIPVILLTAKTAVEHKFEGLRIGADDYITKPFDVKLLVIRCNNLVNSRRLLQRKFIHEPEFSEQQIATTDIDLEFIRKATEIVETNIDNSDFNVDVFASEMALGRTSLFTKLKGVTGLTPNNFISNIRLKKAARMLVNHPEMNVSEIAYSFDFSSPRYFNKCFKELFGCSPNEYRKNNQQ